MAYSDIKKLKKEEEHKEVKVFVKNLVVGNDIFAIDLLRFLNLKESGCAKLLSDEPINEDNLKMLGPSLVRGEENISQLKQLGIEGIESRSVFYKEMKFHKFGSRTKPMPFLWGEEKFSEEHMKVSEQELLPSLKSENLLESVQEDSLLLRIKSIEKTMPEELIDQANWKVHCTNGNVIECENLFWGEPPYAFFQFYENKNELDTDFVSFCESTKTPCTLYVHMQLPQKVVEKKETFFFPLSFTHEWGHFIGEFNETENGQEARFVTFVDKENNNEEDLSKKIRILKKNLEKNFESFSGLNYKENVILKENSYCPKIDDKLLNDCDLMEGKLTFFSFNAPFTKKMMEQDNFEDSWMATSMMTRALLVQQAITR